MDNDINKEDEEKQYNEYKKQILQIIENYFNDTDGKCAEKKTRFMFNTYLKKIILKIQSMNFLNSLIVSFVVHLEPSIHTLAIYFIVFEKI